MNHSPLESVQAIEPDERGTSRNEVRKKLVFINKLKYTQRQQQTIRLCRSIVALEQGPETFLGLVNEDSLCIDDERGSSFLEGWRQDFSSADEFMTEKALLALAAIELDDL